MREAVIVAVGRTAIGKAHKGSLATVRPDEFGAAIIEAILKRIPQLDTQEIDDVIIGCAMPEAEQGLNMARTVSFRAGLPKTTSAVTVNRFCASGLQAIAYASHQIMIGEVEVVIAGGIESMSMVPMGGNKVSLNPCLIDTYPDFYLSMGLTAERVAKQYNISRQAQDEFAYQSHVKALAAISGDKFTDEIIPIVIQKISLNAQNKRETTNLSFAVDEGPRTDTSIETLAKLKPAFHAAGTVTAGNSSQISDGAAAVVIMSADKAKQLGLKPLARFVSFATAGVAPEDMGIGPIYAVPKVLKLANLNISDIKIIELNEAFAAQALAVIKQLELENEKVNINGGAIALGHPLGCTGAKLTVSIIQELMRQGGGYGLVTMCVGGGMGAAGIFEIYT